LIFTYKTCAYPFSHESWYTTSYIHLQCCTLCFSQFTLCLGCHSLPMYAYPSHLFGSSGGSICECILFCSTSSTLMDSLVIVNLLSTKVIVS
jgi:hypothetical protein